MIQSMDCDRKELLESLVSGKAPRHPSWNSKVDLIGDIGEAKLNGNDVIVGSQDGRDRASVGGETRLKHHTGFGTLEIGDPLF